MPALNAPEDPICFHDFLQALYAHDSDSQKLFQQLTVYWKNPFEPEIYSWNIPV